MTEYSRWQRIQIALFGKVYIEHRVREGWTEAHPFYAIRCNANPEHGIVESYPHGSGTLICPKCIEDKWKYA